MHAGSNVTHVHVSWRTKGKIRHKAHIFSLRVNPAEGRSDVSVRLRSIQRSSSIPLSLVSFSVLSLSVSLSHLKLSHQSPLFSPNWLLSSDLHYLPPSPPLFESAPPTHFLLITLFPSFSLLPSFIVSPHLLVLPPPVLSHMFWWSRKHR